MKKKYNSPEFEEIMLSAADLITASLILSEDNDSNGKFGDVEGLGI